MENIIKQNKTLFGLKSIRLFCFFAIYLIHAFSENAIFCRLSFLSISIFIILSGFILSYRYKDETIKCSIKECLKFGFNRIKKLYPLHIVTTIVFIVFFSDYHLYYGGFDSWINWIKSLSPSLIAHIFLIQAWTLDFSIMQNWNAVSWFLSAILFLYIIFPIIHKRVKNFDYKKSLLVILICILLQAIIRPIIYPIITKYVDWSVATYYFPIARVGEFICGCCLFNVWDKTNHLINNKISNILEITLLLILVFYSLLINIDNPYCIFLVTDIALMAVYLFADCKGIITKLLTNKLTIKLGSYSNYAWLIHCFFIQFLQYICSYYNLQVPTIVLVIIGITLSMFFAIVYEKYINYKENNNLNDVHFYEIDFIRVACAIGIIAVHFCDDSNIELPGIGHNVNESYAYIFDGCFILISGYVLRDRYPKIANLKHYFYSRFKSIYPCFWFAWILFAIRQHLLNGVNLTDFNPFSYLLNITALDGFLFQRVDCFYLIGEWFIGAIIICYLVYPIINKLIENKKNLFILIAIFTFLNILHYKYSWPQINVYGLSIITCILEMLLGIFLYEYKKIWNNKHGLLLSVIIFELFVFKKVDFYLYIFVFFHIIAFFIFLYNIGSILNKIDLYKKIVCLLSKYTYCFFLVQHICIYAAICRYKPTNVSEGILVVVLTIITSFILSVFIYHSVNKIKQIFFISENRKRNIVILAITIVFGISGVRLYDYIQERNKIIDDLENYVTYYTSINYYVDSAEIIDDQVLMKGWAYPLDENIENYEIGVEVYEKIYIADKTQRADVKEVLNLDDADVGFTISLYNNEYYQICIVDKKNKIIYK